MSQNYTSKIPYKLFCYTHASWIFINGSSIEFPDPNGKLWQWTDDTIAKPSRHSSIILTTALKRLASAASGANLEGSCSHLKPRSDFSFYRSNFLRRAAGIRKKRFYENWRWRGKCKMEAATSGFWPLMKKSYFILLHWDRSLLCFRNLITQNVIVSGGSNGLWSWQILIDF